MLVDHGSQLSLHIQPSQAINQENQDRTKKQEKPIKPKIKQEKNRKKEDKIGDISVL